MCEEFQDGKKSGFFLFHKWYGFQDIKEMKLTEDKFPLLLLLKDYDPGKDVFSYSIKMVFNSFNYVHEGKRVIGVMLIDAPTAAQEILRN